MKFSPKMSFLAILAISLGLTAGAYAFFAPTLNPVLPGFTTPTPLKLRIPVNQSFTPAQPVGVKDLNDAYRAYKLLQKSA